MPPKSIARLTPRVRTETPPPHVALQLSHVPQSCTKQSTGHGLVAQLFVSTGPGHSVPPCFGCTVTVCVRKVVPEPHVVLQSDQMDQVPAQWIGHDMSLQSRFSERCSHSWPPHRGCTEIWRVNVRFPVPQVFEHADPLSHALRSQSRGQQNVLQEATLSLAPQATPPYCAGVLTERERVLDPVSHDLVHAVHADH